MKTRKYTLIAQDMGKNKLQVIHYETARTTPNQIWNEWYDVLRHRQYPDLEPIGIFRGHHKWMSGEITPTIDWLGEITDHDYGSPYIDSDTV